MDEHSGYEEIILNSNKAALQLIKVSDYQSAKTYLDTSINILSSKPLPNSNKLLGITLNNYGCFYKRQGLLDKALKYFKRSVEASLLAGSGVSETYLNISSVLSQSSKHEDALKAAFQALRSLTSIRNNQKIAVLAYKAISDEFSLLGMPSEARKMLHKAQNISNTNLIGNSSRLSVASRAGSCFKIATKIGFRKESRPRIFSKTPGLDSTDRIFLDFIPAPVNFERFGKASPNLKRGKGRIKTFKKINNNCTICKGKDRRRLDILTPVPKRSKLWLTEKKSYSPLL